MRFQSTKQALAVFWAGGLLLKAAGATQAWAHPRGVERGCGTLVGRTKWGSWAERGVRPSAWKRRSERHREAPVCWAGSGAAGGTGGPRQSQAWSRRRRQPRGRGRRRAGRGRVRGGWTDARGRGAAAPAERWLGAGGARREARLGWAVGGAAGAAVAMETGLPSGSREARPAAVSGRTGRFVPGGAEPRPDYSAGAVRRHSGRTASCGAGACPAELPTRQSCLLRPFCSLGIRCLSAAFPLLSALCVLPLSPEYYLVLRCASLYCLPLRDLTSAVCLPSALLPQSIWPSGPSMGLLTAPPGICFLPAGCSTVCVFFCSHSVMSFSPSLHLMAYKPLVLQDTWFLACQ